MVYSNYILKCSRKLMGGLTYKKEDIKIDDGVLIDFNTPYFFIYILFSENVGRKLR